MHIITVIPIGRGIGKDTLTYFTRESVPAGSIVSVPLRNKSTYGLVVSSQAAAEKKSELKSLTYAIKKIDRISSHSFLSTSFIESVQKMSDYYAATVGAVLSALIPQTILAESEHIEYIPRLVPVSDTFYEKALLQSSDEERYATYKSLIREEFAHNRSVFFCVPTTEDLRNAEILLEKGIEKYTIALHAGLSKKEMLTRWQRALSEAHPVLIIATGSFLSLPRDDIGAIVIEKESSRAYKMQSRPFLDIRTAADILARHRHSRLILGDILLRTETIWEEKNGLAVPLSPLVFRSLSRATCTLESMRIPVDMQKKKFIVMGDALKEILQSSERRGQTFLFCGRKGLYPITVCSDCGTTVLCHNCESPVVLYTGKAPGGQSRHNSKPSPNLFVCHHCGERREAEVLCIHCTGWRLEPLGIGIERVVEEIRELLPDTEILILDSDHVTTHKQATGLRDHFYATPAAIMVGTEMALTYLNQKIQNTAVISLDSFFSIPDFRIHEKIFHILLSLRAMTESRMLVQTRQEKTTLFDQALRGNLIDFYRGEIEERKQLDYPPFTTHVKLTLSGEKIRIKKEMQEIEAEMKPYQVSVFEAFNPGTARDSEIHGLITLPRGEWPQAGLLSKLRALPAHCRVKIDPDSLL